MATITEKILAKASGKRKVCPDEIITAKIDVAMLLHDAAPTTIPAFYEISEKVWDPTKVVVIIEHMIPAHNEWAAESQKQLRLFVKRQNIRHFYEMGRSGICHNLMAEKGHVRPGEVVVGVDSDTTTLGVLGTFSVGIGFTEMAAVLATGEDWFRVPASLRFNINGRPMDKVVGKDVGLYIIGQIGPDRALYKVAEFGGPTITEMSMGGRWSLVNMVDGMSAKSGIIEPDEKTLNYLNGRVKNYSVFKSDLDAEYEEVYEFDVSKLEPQVAEPHLPSNVRPVSEVAGVKIDQSYIGSCTDGGIEDLRQAAEILKDKTIHPDVRVIVMPATQETYLQAMSEGLLDIFIRSGAVIATPSCATCVGTRGVLSKGEVCISTMNKNYKGRMGSPDSYIYLSSPATAAASSVKGEIVDPREL